MAVLHDTWILSLYARFSSGVYIFQRISVVYGQSVTRKV